MPKLKKLPNVLYARLAVFVKKRPFTSFFIALGFLFLAIVANVLTSPKAQEIAKETLAKEVEVYQIGKAAKTNILAKIEKSGVVTIVAQTPGIVARVYVNEGESVGKGKKLLSLANNYSGGNVSSVSRQIASTQYKNAKDTYDAQKDLIGKQREIAEKTDANSDELRNITDKSLSESRDLIKLNDKLLSTIEANLSSFEATNSAGINNELIFTTSQLKSQLLTGNNLLRVNLRNAEYQVSGDKPPAQLSDLQEDITIRQLDLQTKALDMSLEIVKLQLDLAVITEGAMAPMAPFGGVVERVHVSVHESVNPGAPLVTISGSDGEVNAIARVTALVSQRVSKLNESTLYIADREILAKPDYVSHEATDGVFYTILFTIPKEYHSMLTNGEYIRIKIPIGIADTGETVPFIPIDSVFQTQEETFVYVVDENRAKSKKVMLGQVVGGDVEVLDGLSQGDQVIINRNVLGGDRIVIRN